jgi:hypothetical protein
VSWRRGNGSTLVYNYNTAEFTEIKSSGNAATFFQAGGGDLAAGAEYFEGRVLMDLMQRFPIQLQN